MDILQLRYFYESAHRGFAKTAEKYMVPASSVSVTVKRLERELGVLLFERQANRILLNENGRRFLRVAENILGELDRVTTEFSDDGVQNVDMRILLYSLRPSITRAIIAYRKLHPSLRFRIDLYHEKPDFAQYDLIFGTDCETPPAGFENFWHTRRRMRMMVASDSPLCKRPLTMRQLSAWPFLVFSRGGVHEGLLKRECEKAGFTPNVVMEINDTTYYQWCVRAGMGIGLTRSRALPEDSGMDILDVADFDGHLTYFAHCKCNARHPEIQNFIEFLKLRSR